MSVGQRCSWRGVKDRKPGRYFLPRDYTSEFIGGVARWHGLKGRAGGEIREGGSPWVRLFPRPRTLALLLPDQILLAVGFIPAPPVENPPEPLDKHRVLRYKVIKIAALRMHLPRLAKARQPAAPLQAHLGRGGHRGPGPLRPLPTVGGAPDRRNPARGLQAGDGGRGLADSGERAAARSARRGGRVLARPPQAKEAQPWETG